ncbi:MAG: hypothetical protein HQK75_07720 [Candidatus Magnetomorum sp.]|nr:hypothetical protein [Candidatus Magnetomorum sp.]
MSFSKFNLKLRMMMIISCVAFVAFTVTIGVVTYESSKIAEIEAIDKAQQMTRRYANQIETEMEQYMSIARNMAHVFEGMKTASHVPERRIIDNMLKHVLEKNSFLLGVWTCWEPNALDGKDSEFVNKPGHDQTGRYIPYWNRGGGNIKVEPLVDYDKEGAGDYYQISLRTAQESILDPYLYPIDGKEILLTSLVAPIKIEGKTVGVAGVDITLLRFEKLTSTIKPYGSGYSYLLSNTGLFVAHPTLTGKNIKDYAKSEILQAIKKGTEIEDIAIMQVTGEKAYVYYAPVTIGQTTTPWSFAINVPYKKILENTTSMIIMTAVISIVALILLSVVVFFISKGISDPLSRMAEQLLDTANNVDKNAGNILSISNELLEKSGAQVSSIEETSASLEEISSMTRQNADNARQTNSLMRSTNTIMDETNRSMHELNTSMEEISKASEETSKIIKTIDEIAFQTNLLALNAAVEAARAGEAGAGFAVVADEVRNLAMRSAEAAKNTAQLIEDTVKKVKNGAILVSQTNEGFSQVGKSGVTVGNLVQEIDDASTEQSQGIEQINRAIQDIDHNVQDTSVGSERASAAATEMKNQAEAMNDIIQDLIRLVEGDKGH